MSLTRQEVQNMRTWKSSICFTIMPLLFIATNCATTAEKARLNLEQMNIPFSEDSFAQR